MSAELRNRIFDSFTDIVAIINEEYTSIIEYNS